MNKLPFIQRGDVGNISFRRSQNHFNLVLFIFFIFILPVCFMLLIIRLFQLTVVSGTYYRRLSEENRIREIIIEAKRGSLIDRQGKIIAANTDANLKNKQERLSSKRNYAFPNIMSHVIGYRGIATKEETDTDTCQAKVALGDRIGKKGVEKLYDCDLRGKAGRKLIEVNAPGKTVRTISVIPPVEGKALTLSLDSKLNSKAHELLEGKIGAVVGIIPQTGEVIVMESSPTFNIQHFEDSKGDILKNYFTDTNKPLFNRSTEASYPPGSVFKLAVGAAALEEKKFTTATLIEDTGFIQAGPARFGNWYFIEYGKTEGAVDIFKALQRSNDIYFYKAGEALGVEKMKKWTQLFGFGQKTGIGIDEVSGLIPSPFWKDEFLHEQWYLGDTYNMSIGQGYTLVTPLQTALSTIPFANGGYLCTPYLLKVNDENKPSCKKLPITQKTIDIVREGMKRACETGGTGYPFFEFKPLVGCKTGTAESHGTETKPHAWFTVFAPFEKPEIVISVLVEEAGQGSDVAAPIAKGVLEEYFKN